jgi:hypothetical protein
VGIGINLECRDGHTLTDIRFILAPVPAQLQTISVRTGVAPGQNPADPLWRPREKLGDGKPETFDFLGVTHFCTRSRKRGRHPRVAQRPVFAIGRPVTILRHSRHSRRPLMRRRVVRSTWPRRHHCHSTSGPAFMSAFMLAEGGPILVSGTPAAVLSAGGRSGIITRSISGSLVSKRISQGRASKTTSPRSPRRSAPSPPTSTGTR